MGVFSIFRLGPKEYFRQTFKLPLIIFIHSTIELFRTKTKSGVSQIRTTLFRGTVVSFITSLLVWLAILMYLAFYYAYVPTVSHEKPIHLQFKPCSDNKGMCSFPSAHIELTKRQQLLMLGQPYKVHVELDMPESPANKELGMFMVCVDFRGQHSSLIASSCRATMLHYRSSALEFLNTVVFSPMLLFGGVEQKQKLCVELFADYEETESEPVVDVYVEIQSQFVEIYSAKFLINAHFTGLRFVMFNWPIVSAVIGITSNLFFIAVVCLISWYQLIHSEDYRNYVLSKQTLEHYQGDLDDDSSVSSVDDASFLEENVRKRHSTQNVENLRHDITHE